MLFFAPRSLCCLFLMASLAACSYGTEKRLSTLEAQMQSQAILDLRLAHLEDRLSMVEQGIGHMRATGQETKGKTPGADKGPRIVQPRPAAAVAPQAQPTALATASAQRTDPVPPATVTTATLSPQVAEAQGLAPQPAPSAENKVPQPRPVSPSPTVEQPGPEQAAPAAKGISREYQLALNTYEQGQYAKAYEQFAAFLTANPQHSLAPNALYWMGECLYSQGRFDAAILAFKDVAGKHTKHPKAAAALLKAGFAYARLKDPQNARFYWQMLIDDFPGSAPAKVAQQRIKEG